MARVRLRAVEKRFGDLHVLAPLDLTIEEGEFFTVVGPSGCGKSTLLNLIAGIEQPSAGQILFDDERVDLLVPRLRDVAMVFQSYALYPHLSVRDNIAFPLRARGIDRSAIGTAVDRIAARLAILDLLDRKPGALSGGQRQRVALGRALVRQPRVFLMDEPLSNLDARLRLAMRDELKRLHREFGVTTVYVTHDQEEALALSDRIAVLDAGRVQQCASPATLYTDPDNLFVAGFLGSPPLNVIDGALLAAAPAIGSTRGASAVRTCVAGLRPADLVLRGDAVPGSLEVAVSLTESTGSELWVVGEWQGQSVRARAAEGFRPEVGTRAWLDLAQAPVYWFDRASGARIRG
ncbi:MAG TPA: ABC transporter ATP-binding protein [Steroidobacteraceae bacterium]|nr:ABC transporter ATP-binding protein [Steroidobacteraceae bacterium]